MIIMNNLFDMNMVYGVCIVVLFCGVLIAMKRNGIKFSYYDEVKLALLMGGTMFKDTKIKMIMGICMGIVQGLENADKSSAEKRKEAITKAIEEIYEKCGVKMDKEIIGQIIDIAVANMPENK